MKNILLTQRYYKHDKSGELRNSLETSWGNFFMECGLLAIPALVTIKAKDLIENIQPAGIVLTGGGSISTIEESEFAKKRDELENALLEFAVEKDIPLIGVCRGMQVICQYFGANFFNINNHVAVSHDIELSSDRLGELTQLKNVNSFHDTGIREVKEPLKAVGYSGNCIEAVEHESKNIYGIMWHPERHSPFNREEINFFKRVFGS